jgi:hypothetical protein
VSGDDGVAERPHRLGAEPLGLVANELIDLLKRVFVEEDIDPFPRGQLTLFVLASDRSLRSSMQSLVLQLPEMFDPRFGAQEFSVSLLRLDQEQYGYTLFADIH